MPLIVEDEVQLCDVGESILPKYALADYHDIELAFTEPVMLEARFDVINFGKDPFLSMQEIPHLVQA